MNTKNSIRIAIGLIAIHLLGHTMGHLGWDKPEDTKMQEVVSVMKSHSADFMGATRSMADYYNGYSLILFAVFGLSIWILWNFINHLHESPKLVKKGLFGFSIMYFIVGIIEWFYFFPFASVVSLLIGVFLLFGASKMNKTA